MSPQTNIPVGLRTVLYKIRPNNTRGPQCQEALPSNQSPITNSELIKKGSEENNEMDKVVVLTVWCLFTLIKTRCQDKRPAQ